MKTEKIIKELVRRGLEFRGEISMEEALKNPDIYKGEIQYACKKYSCNTLLYFARREAPEGGKLGDAGTDCKEILITVDNSNDDAALHYVMTASWFIPEMCSNENPDGVFHLEVDDDCRIKACSHKCGCFSTTAWRFNEYWKMSFSDFIMNSFDAVAGNKGSMGFLPETCLPVER